MTQEVRRVLCVEVFARKTDRDSFVDQLSTVYELLTYPVHTVSRPHIQYLIVTLYIRKRRVVMVLFKCRIAMMRVNFITIFKKTGRQDRSRPTRTTDNKLFLQFFIWPTFM